MEEMLPTENPMGTAKISGLVLKTGLPLIISLLINSLYNFVDSVFVARISEDALTALSLAAPVQIIMSAMGLGIAVGLNAVISRALGERNRKRVEETASAALVLAFLAWVLVVILEAAVMKPYFRWQSGGVGTIMDYGIPYLRICMLGSLGMMGQWVFDRFVMASGKSSLFLFTLSAASITNLVLDPILIFGYFGLPAMGTAGAALATVIGQWVGCFAGYFINRRWNREIPIHFTIKADTGCMGAILKVGIPSTFVQVITSVLAIYVNSVLMAINTHGGCRLRCVCKSTGACDGRSEWYGKRADSHCGVQLWSKKAGKDLPELPVGDVLFRYAIQRIFSGYGNCTGAGAFVV